MELDEGASPRSQRHPCPGGCFSVMLYSGQSTHREWDHEQHHTIPDDIRGGVALLGLASEAGAQSSCPLAEADWNSFKPYICNVNQPAGGNTEKVTWRVTFSEPVGGVSWHDFMTDNSNDYVPGHTDRRYGLGTVTEEIKKVSDTEYDISMEWDCTASDNDCFHNEDFTPTYQVGARQDRYVGEVWLELQSDAEFNEIQSPVLDNQMTRSHAGIPTTRVAVN